MSIINLYFSKSFSRTDLPITTAVLKENCTVQQVTVSELLDSNAYSRIIRVNYAATTANKKNANLLKFAEDSQSGFWYYVTGYRWHNANVIELTLSISGILTTHLFETAASALPVSISGTITRESHKDSDPVNMLREPFIPTAPYKKKILSHAYPVITVNNKTAMHTFYSSSIDLADKALAKNEILLATYASDNKIASYEVEPSPVKMATPTKFYMLTPFTNQTLQDGWSFSGLGVYSEDAGDEQDKTFTNLNAMGLDSVIKDRWTIPQNYITMQTGAHNKVTQLIGKLQDSAAAGLKDTLENPLDYQNEKAKYYFCNVSLVAKASGNYRKFRWLDISDPQNIESTAFQAIANPAPNGKPYIYPVYFQQTQQNVLWIMGLLPGAQWAHPGRVTEGNTGKIISDFQTAEAISNQGLGALTSGIGGVLSILGADKAGQTISPASGLFTANMTGSQSIDQLKNQQNIRNTVYSPSYIPPEVPELAGAVPNNFMIMSENLSTEDMKNFDKFLTNYGWAQNKMFSGETMTAEVDGRGDDFCYLQFGGDLDITPRAAASYDGISTYDAGNTLCEVLKTELQSGIRLWRKATRFDIWR